MQRKIVRPPVPGELALAELKHWLGISRPDDDAALAGLLDTSLTICEAFTGKAPLRQVVEETISLRSGWQELTARPVRAVTAAALIAADGSRTPFADPAEALEWHIAGGACVQVLQAFEGSGVAVELEVGIADGWPTLPAPLRQGIIRLAAHYHRDRDSKASAVPPASVTALWRPWRDVRLA